MQQTTANIMMVRPVSFGHNPQTAENNAFQTKKANDAEVLQQAQAEFDGMVAMLREAGVNVLVFDDTPHPPKPSAIFPNNWVSFHEEGVVILYPLYAPNRREERQEEILIALEQQFDKQILLDFSPYESSGKYLESTGSMIIDRPHKVIYACRSERTHEQVLQVVAEKLSYEYLLFDAVDEQKQAIYHTNVMMCLGQDFAVICLDLLPNAAERKAVVDKLQQTHKQIVALSTEQIAQFAGNMLEVQSTQGDRLLVMSARALKSLTPDQRNALEQKVKIVAPPLYTIEDHEGGSARCMMAEVFLPEKQS
ncbi:citrulline utilization hydrolase CtlX [Microscilla marina]|uniref:Amidinotransferase superfamily n=1 Tax=Microscilla marina ATCC 23134 TaxID=313606 RepID=A1ZS16_MICM2|nr:arginine deiminase-related protein [Microscilla marina]EAY26739.1 amidinotransferase superfamily [Microscilla marina ATCC 23134]